jgi:hypothetical protein
MKRFARANWRLPGFIFASSLAAVFSFQVTAVALEEISEGRPILTFEKAIPFRDYPHAMAWSPNGRHLAVKSFNDGKLHLLDVEQQTDRVIAERIGNASLAWSPDGKLIAVRHDAPVSSIRLVTVAGQEVVHRLFPPKEMYDGCPVTDAPMAFTSTGASLWTACNLYNAQGEFLAAAKLRVSDLGVEDRLHFVAPIPQQKARSFNYSFAHLRGALLLSSIIYSGTDIRQPGGMKERFFGAGINLDSKDSLFPTFELADDNRSGYFRAPVSLILLENPTYALARLSTSRSVVPGVPSQARVDRLFEGYDVRTGRRIVTYGGEGEHKPESGAIGETAAVNGSELMIAPWSGDGDRGGLIAFDGRTGNTLQRLTFDRNARLALSPDGKRVATFSFRNEVRIFRVESQAQ